MLEVLTMGELTNCLKCNAVFVKTTQDICPDCVRKEEKTFQKVYRFLSKRENREETIAEIVKATEVEEELITKFIRTNRVQRSRFPKLAYPCESRGVYLVSGKLCEECSNEILTKFEQAEKSAEKEKQQRKKEKKIDTYYSINKKNL